MADYVFTQNNFTAGELSTKISQGRSDLEKYYTGAETMLNFIPLPQGGVIKRPGFQYIATAKTSTGVVRLIPFVFSPTQAYIIEASNNTFRFFSDGGQIKSAGATNSLLLHMDGTYGSTTFTDSGNTGHTVTANGGAIIWPYKKVLGTASGWFDGSGDYLSIPDHADFNLSAAFTLEMFIRPIYTGSANTRCLYYHGTDDDNYMSVYLWTADGDEYFLYLVVKAAGSTVISMSSSPYTILPDVWTHVVVQRSGADYYSFAFDGVFVHGVDYTGVGPGNFTGTVLIGKSGNTGGAGYFHGYMDELRLINGAAAFTFPFTLPSAPYSGAGDIYEVTSGMAEQDIAITQWVQSFDTLYMASPYLVLKKLVRSGHADWAASTVTLTETPFGAGNYPISLAIHQGRLYLGGSLTYPFRIWASQLDSFGDLTTGTDADDGFVINILSQQSESIQWMTTSRSKLVIGTGSSIWQLTGGALNDAITPTNRVANRCLSYGSTRITPVTAGDSLVFIQADKKRIRSVDPKENVYSENTIQAKDLTILSDHITETRTIKEVAFQTSPFGIIWCLLDNGTLASLTYLPEHEVTALARHTTDGEILSIACIPGVDGYDELWIAVKRNINGSDATYIERMGNYYFGSDIADANYLDSYLRYEGGGVGTVSGADHLEGETVTVYRSYGYLDKTVTSGTVSLQPVDGIGYTYTKALIGLPYQCDLKTVSPISRETRKQITPLTTKRFTGVSLFVRNSYGGQYGISSSDLYDLITGSTTSAGESGLITDKAITANWDNHPTLFIRGNDPYPLNIDSIMIEMELGD